MTPEHDESGLLKSWLDETYEAERDAQPFLDRMLDDVSGTRQHRRRWWRLPTLRRSPAQPSTDQSTDYQPSPISALNGHTPTVLGRTQSMFSPVKAITAGALIFAIGGAFLIAQPFDQQGAGVPAAAGDTEPVPATWVTGKIALSPSCTGPMAGSHPGDVQPEREHHRCGRDRWATSDPRLTGNSTITWDADVYLLDEAIVSVKAGTYEVRNDSGGWLCHYRDGLAHRMGRYATAANEETVTCTGDGAYEGLTAIVYIDWSGGPSTSPPLAGLIFRGEAPPLPELRATE